MSSYFVFAAVMSSYFPVATVTHNYFPVAAASQGKTVCGVEGCPHVDFTYGNHMWTPHVDTQTTCGTSHAVITCEVYISSSKQLDVPSPKRLDVTSSKRLNVVISNRLTLDCSDQPKVRSSMPMPMSVSTVAKPPMYPPTITKSLRSEPTVIKPLKTFSGGGVMGGVMCSVPGTLP